MSSYIKVAIKAAIESGRFIRNSVGMVERVSYKGRDNIVTDVDEKSERMIMSRISSAFPGHSILTEESGFHTKNSSHRWVIDPLDGTTNFAHAFPFFCVSIALEISGRCVLGVVYDPMRDELFWAQKGSGAHLNKKRIYVSTKDRLKDSLLATGFSYGNDRKDRNIPYFRKFLLNTMAIRRAGSAALDLSYVACGRFDGYWEMDLKPWDSAAGTLLVREAGGSVTKFDGKMHSPYDKEILASNGIIHKKMVKMLVS